MVLYYLALFGIIWQFWLVWPVWQFGKFGSWQFWHLNIYHRILFILLIILNFKNFNNNLLPSKMHYWTIIETLLYRIRDFFCFNSIHIKIIDFIVNIPLELRFDKRIIKVLFHQPNCIFHYKNATIFWKL